MRRFFIGLLAITVMALAGCSDYAAGTTAAVNESAIDQVKPGMTMEQVKALMGEPTSTHYLDNGDLVAEYSLDTGGETTESKLARGASFIPYVGGLAAMAGDGTQTQSRMVDVKYSSEKTVLDVETSQSAGKSGF